jgi:hypothetical protein
MNPFLMFDIKNWFMKNRVVILMLFLFYRDCFVYAQDQQEKKPHTYQLVHIYLGAGPGIPITGNMWEVYARDPYEGFSGGSVGGLPERHNKSGNLSLGAEFSLNQRLRLGAWILPTSHKCFEGAIGKNGTTLFVFDVIYTGKHVQEELYSKSYMVGASGVIFPYNPAKWFGTELVAGVGLLVTKFDARTSLWAFDTTRVYNSSGGYYQTQQQTERKDFTEQKTCYGAVFTIRGSLYLGKHFSLFAQIMAGAGSSITISEKSLTVNRETAYVRRHDERISGVGASGGISFHFIEKKSSNTNGTQ